MADPPVVSQQEWLAARKQLLAEEKESIRQRDALSAERRGLPMAKIGNQYLFEGRDGNAGLPELFAFPNLTTKTALALLTAAPTPAAAAELTTADLERLLVTTGRGVRRSEVTRLAQAFAVTQLRQPAPVEEAMGVAVQALVRTLAQTSAPISDLEDALAERFDDHPDAEILRSLPGLGVVLGGRVLGEFGDDRTRFVDAASRRCYAGTAPVTRASGKTRVVLLRRARNQRLANACRQWAFVAIHQSPGARAYYKQRRAAGDGHETALRRLACKLVGQLHHCLAQREPYREESAWPVDEPAAAA
ncbi:MAG TPA: DUF899 family protein [Streptosporangiales bacterium]